MAKRFKMRKRGSKKYFSRGAGRVHMKNNLQGGSLAMRGGIRL